MKILVIEDHPAQLKLAHHVLSAAGHNVSDADAGEQAMQTIQDDRPEVILLDLCLPGMDGLTLVRKLRADPKMRDIHIIAVTSFPERFPESAALGAGCNAYLIKPISTRTLPAQVSAVVRRENRES
jgi:DNA-binding response OmpR family regulator